MSIKSISQNLPDRGSFTHIQPQVWVKWMVSHPKATVAIGVVAVVFLYVVSLVIRRGRPEKKPENPIVPFPQDQRTNCCFITIEQDLIDLKSVGSKDIRVIVEDTEERRIAAKYLQIVEGEADFIAKLPPNREIIVRLEELLTSGVMNPVGAPVSFTSSEHPASYQISAKKVYRQRLTALDARGRPNVWNPSNSMQKKYMHTTGMLVNLSKDSADMVTEDRVGIRTITIFKPDDLVYKCVEITLQAFSFHIPTISVFYPVQDPGNKQLNFVTVIKDFKEAYLLLNGDEFRPGTSDEDLAKELYIHSIRYQSYQLLPSAEDDFGSGSSSSEEADS